MICPTCGFENPAGIKFCGGCATPVALRCASCGFASPPGFRFCGDCGRPLAREAVSAVSAGPRDPRAYTPAHLADRILTSRSALEGERKQVTVLFADVECSMELAEQVGAEEWHRILDRFFAILADGVHRFEGTINQFTGDGIMALFGAPLAHEDHARRACHAVLYLADGLRRYGEELKRSLGLGFSVRMGLNSGEVVVGRIGDDLRMDYTAQGHTVGLAARMEHLAGPDRIYLTEHTAALVAGYFRLRDLGRFPLKGVREPISVYELEGLGPVRTRLDASRARGLSRLVGREEELAVLDQALARAVAGAGEVVALIADAGVGKSRLCFELAERCRARGIRFVEGHALSHGRMIPFLPWIDLLRNDFGIAPGDGDDAARDKIAGRTLRLEPELADSLPLLFDFLGVPDPERPSPPMDAEARQRRLLDATRQLVRARSRREPAVILFEDLHWMDGGSAAFLAALVEVVPQTRTLLVVTARPETRAPWMDRPGVRRRALVPLAPDAAESLIGDLLGRDPTLDGVAARIRERAAGNPFFIEEVVRSLVESGALAGAPGSYRPVRPVDQLAIPASVEAILAARIDRLGEPQKQILQAAAVIGRSFLESILARATEMSVADLRAPLDALIAAGLIAEEDPARPGELEFEHPLTQEVAYRAQLAERRARTHERVARALEEAIGGKRDQRAALVSHHLEAAGRKIEAARWSGRAALWARSSSLAESRAHWQRVLALLGGLAPSPEVIALTLEAQAALLSLGWLLGTTLEEARALYDRSRALAQQAGDHRALALVTAQYAGIKAAHREIDEYVRLSWEAMQIASRVGDAELSAAVWPGVVRAHLLSGRLGEALALSDRALGEMPEDPSFGTLLGYSPYLNLVQLRANLLGYAGRWPEASAAFEQVIAVARGVGHPGLVASASSDYGWWAAILDGPQRALAHAQRGLEIAEKLGNQMTRVYACNALGVAELAGGRVDRASAVLEHALEIAREMRTGGEAALLTLAHLAEARLAGGDPTAARELAERAVRAACEQGVPTAECFARIVYARALLRSDAGPSPEAAAALDRALELIEQTGARCYEPFARLERADLAGARGDESGRQREAAQARALFAEMGARLPGERAAG